MDGQSIASFFAVYDGHGHRITCDYLMEKLHYEVYKAFSAPKEQLQAEINKGRHSAFQLTSYTFSFQ